MPTTPEHHNPEERHPEKHHQEHGNSGYKGSISEGYEVTDVNVPGVIVFMTSLFVFVGVFFVFCFGLGKVINTAIVKNDGPLNRWNANLIAPKAGREDMTPSAVMEQKQYREMVQRFPTPRVETDNGDLDITELHAREDLLLDNYSWANRAQGKIRIPISRAMELVAQRGLPVAPASETEPLMAGDKPVVVPVPLTDGFARTGYEQQYLETMEQQRERGEAPPEQASAAPVR